MDLEKRKYLVKKVCLVMDIIVLLALIGMAIWFYNEAELFESATGDPCKICELKTNGTCFVIRDGKYFNLGLHEHDLELEGFKVSGIKKDPFNISDIKIIK